VLEWIISLLTNYQKGCQVKLMTRRNGGVSVRHILWLVVILVVLLVIMPLFIENIVIKGRMKQFKELAEEVRVTKNEKTGFYLLKYMMPRSNKWEYIRRVKFSEFDSLDMQELGYGVPEIIGLDERRWLRVRKAAIKPEGQ
jgi:hypothetical protein